MDAGTTHTIWWSQPAGGFSRFSHHITFSTESGSQKQLQEEVLKVLAHFLVDQVPAAGLTELCQNVYEVLDFYAVRSSSTQLLPSQSSVKARVTELPSPKEFYLEA